MLGECLEPLAESSVDYDELRFRTVTSRESGGRKVF